MLITMTRTLFLLLLICYMSNAEYSANCSDDSQNSLVLKASNDGVGGRYILTWCTKANINVNKWKLVMRYQENRAPERCHKYNYGMPIGNLHSSFEEIIKLDLNCTNVCFSTNLDLIFNSTCYHIHSVLYEDNKSFTPFNSLHYIINEYPKEHFTQSKAVCSTLSYGEELVVHWYLGYIPATDYTMYLCNSSALQDSQCVNISSACAAAGAAQSEVRCARAARFGCYDVVLRHRAPWTNAERLFGALHILHHKTCHAAPRVTGARPARASLWVALGAAAALLLAALLLLRALRSRFDNALAARVLGGWRSAPDRTESEPVMKTAPAKEPEEQAQIVLLYARDCEQFTHMAELLRELLAERAGCPVVDLYQARTLSAAARAPAEWLQRALDAEGARVVLLQSPAAACLHAARHERAPAHGQRVLYREPQAGDWLLTLALRRLAETGHLGLPYRKYFVAGVSGVEADVLPGLTPQRRYALPGAAELLLRDVAPGAAPRAPAALRRAAEQYAAYARAHPGYVDELFYMRHG